MTLQITIKWTVTCKEILGWAYGAGLEEGAGATKVDDGSAEETTGADHRNMMSIIFQHQKLRGKSSPGDDSTTTGAGELDDSTGIADDEGGGAT